MFIGYIGATIKQPETVERQQGTEGKRSLLKRVGTKSLVAVLPLLQRFGVT
jgi:hypothetical protein